MDMSIALNVMIARLTESHNIYWLDFDETWQKCYTLGSINCIIVLSLLYGMLIYRHDDLPLLPPLDDEGGDENANDGGDENANDGGDENLDEWDALVHSFEWTLNPSYQPDM